MGTQSLRLKVGSIYTKGPGKIYYFCYQAEGHRKTVSLQPGGSVEKGADVSAGDPVFQHGCDRRTRQLCQGTAGGPAGYAPCRCMELLRTAA